MGLGRALLALTCAALGDKIKSNCSSYSLQCVQTYTFFALMECWVFSSRNLVFNKGSLVLEWLSKSASWREVKSSWSWFMDQSQFSVQSQDWGLSTYYLIHRWERLLLGHLENGAGSHSPHKGIFISGWTPKHLLSWGDKNEGCPITSWRQQHSTLSLKFILTSDNER